MNTTTKNQETPTDRIYFFLQDLRNCINSKVEITPTNLVDKHKANKYTFKMLLEREWVKSIGDKKYAWTSNVNIDNDTLRFYANRLIEDCSDAQKKTAQNRKLGIIQRKRSSKPKLKSTFKANVTPALLSNHKPIDLTQTPTPVLKSDTEVMISKQALLVMKHFSLESNINIHHNGLVLFNVNSLYFTLDEERCMIVSCLNKDNQTMSKIQLGESSNYYLDIQRIDSKNLNFKIRV